MPGIAINSCFDAVLRSTSPAFAAGFAAWVFAAVVAGALFATRTLIRQVLSAVAQFDKGLGWTDDSCPASG